MKKKRYRKGVNFWRDDLDGSESPVVERALEGFAEMGAWAAQL